ncbi:tetratricopeptide repeat-containing protein [Pontibaca methylaminivorans]|uniref:tetratricopeptide repeat-containing protein n=1 Tax=Pontibaca methylaminivorans TaxID=515897 RepID=UPI002FD9BA62
MHMETSMNRTIEDRKTREDQAARAAGWSRADILWERLMERGNSAYLDGNTAGARALFRRADLLSRVAFAGSDLRRATAAANLALLAVGEGQQGRARRFQRRALDIWKHAPEQIAGMKIAPRTRSSLYHLRMEVKHRETYHDNMRIRFSRFAAETGETLRSLTAPPPLPHRHHGRWLGERPGVHDDSRKILSACLLIIDPR